MNLTHRSAFVKRGRKTTLTALLLCFLALASAASEPGPGRHPRGEGEPEQINYYLDADRDGFGAGPPRRASKPPGEGWVTNDGDCDDSDPRVYTLKTKIVLDCDSDTVADDIRPRSACVGHGAIFYWHDSKGYLNAMFHYPDARGFWWIDSENAARNAAQEILLDRSPGCADR